jgi:polysaccharide biosynthesis/export protein
MIIKSSNKRYYFVIAVLVYSSLFLSSCISNKKITYFQDIDEGATYSDTIKYDRNRYKFQVNDILNLQVKSVNTDFQNYFVNPTVTGSNLSSLSGQSGGDLYYTIGYSINDSGCINFPMLGPVHIAGLTLSEIEEKN